MNNLQISIYAVSGVYNNAIYIGSTNNLERREKEHFGALGNGTHYNSLLQASYDVFGEDNLTVIVLEQASNSTARKTKEKEWTLKLSQNYGLAVCNKHVGGGNTSSGYKLLEETRKKQSEAKTGRPIEQTRAQNYVFISPEGREFKCTGLKEVCQPNNLNIAHMSRVANGKLRHHKGWTIKKQSDSD